MSMSPTIFQQSDSGEVFFSFRKSETEKYNNFIPNTSEIEEYVNLPKIYKYLESKGIIVDGGFEINQEYVTYYFNEGNNSDFITYKEIPDSIKEEETYYLLGNEKGHLEPTENYRKWVYENDRELVYVKEAKQFFPQPHFIHDIMDEWIIFNNY